MTSLTHRWFALLVPAIGQAIVWLMLAYIRRNTVHHDESLEYMLGLIGTMVLCIVLLRRAPFNSFWKTHLFAVASALLPFVVIATIATAIYGTGGYWWLGMMSMSFLVIVTSIISLPVTWFVLWIIRQREIYRYR